MFARRTKLLAATLISLGVLAGFAAPKRPAVRKAPPAAKKATSKKAVPKKPAAAVPSPTAASWLSSLTLREKVAQLVMIGFNGHPMNIRSREYRKFINLVQKEHVGGLILVNVANGRVTSKADPLEAASFINRMQRLAKIPLVIAGDFERGASMRIDATTVFPHAMAFAATRDPELARKEGEITARESRAMGFQWIFFPDADVNNNPDNPIINIRSYGEDPADVSKFVSAFIEGAHSDPKNRVLVTAKHFPGHGDTATDTHMNLGTVPADRDRLEKVEWAPFRAAIASGVDSIMTAHLAVPALDDPGVPATLSSKILTGILRDELSFSGLIVTDALEMGGIAQGFSAGDAAVRAVEAGADVLLMPADPLAAINAVVAAVRSGRISTERINRSVMRILASKAQLGLGAKKLINLEAIHAIVDSEESNAVAQQIADRSVTLVKNDKSMVPLRAAAANTVFFTMSEGPTSIEGQAFAAEVKRLAPGARVIQVDSSMADSDLASMPERAPQASRYVLAVFASVAANRGTIGLNSGYTKMVHNLIATKKPVAMIALGNPYLLRDFPDLAAYIATYSTVPPSEIAAAKALFGSISIQGKLPITIPGFAAYGDGLQLPALVP